jgi:hypothetical protein
MKSPSPATPSAATASAGLTPVQEVLANLLSEPSLSGARALEDALRSAGSKRRVFGRVNQKASLEANSESDRGIAERLANAFDASLTAARIAVGITKSSKGLSPRKAAQRFFCPNTAKCNWLPQDKRITVQPPFIEFWTEGRTAKVRHRKYHTDEGLSTVLVSDSGIGITREEMPSTILDLNSDSKLETFEAIGQFGHGGSSSLAFCESALVASQPRFGSDPDRFFWTLIFPERSHGDSKQELVRYWFCDEDDLPYVGRLADVPALSHVLPGTAVWHFGYSRGDWIKPITGPEQTNPWGRLGRLFFSYPLPFDVRGELARTDTAAKQRRLKGAFFRLLDEKDDVEYRSGEKSASLIIGGTSFGEFHAFFFVLKQGARVRNYVHPLHPIIGTLNGQNHGEMTKTIVASAGLPELSSSMIIELRLDDLDPEALSNIVANSRETFKSTAFTRALQERLQEMLEEDEVLQDLELRRQEAKAREASSDMSKRLSDFLSAILSDAVGRPGPAKGGSAPGKTRKRDQALPEVPESDPPSLLEFVFDSPLVVPESTTKLAKFKSDARPPKYSFYGDNPRLFAEFRPDGPYRDRISVSGRADLNPKGYGSISVSCMEDSASPIAAKTPAGELHLILQSASGKTLRARIPVAVDARPPELGRRRDPAVRVELRFSCPDITQAEDLKKLLAEPTISDMGPELRQRTEALQLEPGEATYVGDKASRHGESYLRVEVNAANPQLQGLLQSCKTAEERIKAKDRYCRDLVLDAYQHLFELETVPEAVTVYAQASEEVALAAEGFLNHDKAIRFAIEERERDRKASN